MNIPDFIDKNIVIHCKEFWVNHDQNNEEHYSIKEYNKKISDFNCWNECIAYDVAGYKYKAITFESNDVDCEVIYNQLNDIRNVLPEEYIDIVPLDYQLIGWGIPNEFDFQEFKDNILDYYDTSELDYILISNDSICVFWGKTPNKYFHPLDWKQYKIYFINKNANINELYKEFYEKIEAQKS